jgi:hypothetical protein
LEANIAIDSGERKLEELQVDGFACFCVLHAPFATQ